MKNILRAIVEYLNNDYQVHVVFVFVILVGLIVGITKNWKAINSRRGSYFFLTLSILLLVLIMACFFMFPLSEYIHIMYFEILAMAGILGLVFNAELIVSDIHSKQRKALANIFLIFLFIVVAFFIVNGQYIKCSVGLLLMS